MTVRTPRADGGFGTTDVWAGAWSEGTVGRWYSPNPTTESGNSEMSGIVRASMEDAALFRAGCPDCRASFVLPAEALRLVMGASHRTTFYTFTCPECGASVRKPAGERIVELLARGGVRTLRLHSAV